MANSSRALRYGSRAFVACCICSRASPLRPWRLSPAAACTAAAPLRLRLKSNKLLTPAAAFAAAAMPLRRAQNAPAGNHAAGWTHTRTRTSSHTCMPLSSLSHLWDIYQHLKNGGGIDAEKLAARYFDSYALRADDAFSARTYGDATRASGYLLLINHCGMPVEGKERGGERGK